MSKVFRIIFLVVVLIAAISFSVVNAHDVRLNYYLGEIDLPLSFIIVASLIVGAALGSIAMLKPLFGQKLENAKLKKTIRVNEKEITNLRSIPVKEP